MGSYLAAKTWGALLREEALGRNLFLMSQGHGQGIHTSAQTPGNNKEKRWVAQILSNNYYVYRRVFYAKYWLPDILTYQHTIVKYCQNIPKYQDKHLIAEQAAFQTRSPQLS